MENSTPNWTAWLAEVWGPSNGCDGFGTILAGASNLVFGTNPPYTLQDFLSFYPKFGGCPITPAPQGTTALAPPTITMTATGGIKVGNPIAGSGIPNGSYVTAVTSGNITISQNATAAATVELTIWNKPPIPFVVIQAFIALASSNLIQARWLEQWTFAMGLFVAHYLTLYAQTDGTADSNGAQIAAQGVSSGLQIAKAVGDVSVSYKPLDGMEMWAAFNLTKYGQQLATMAKVVGMGTYFVY